MMMMPNRNWYVRIALMLWGLACSITGLPQSQRSNELFVQGVELYQQRKYQKALAIFKEMQALDYVEMDSTNNRRSYGDFWIASCLYRLGREQEAEELDNMQFYLVPPVDRRLTLKSDSMATLAEQMQMQGKYDVAIKYYWQCSEIEKKVLGEQSLWYANTLCNMGEMHVMLQQLDDAIMCFEQGLHIIKTAIGKNYRYYFHLRLLSACLIWKGDLSETAFEYLKDAAGLAVRYSDDENIAYLLGSYANYCLQSKRYTDALPLLELGRAYYKERNDSVHERELLGGLTTLYTNYIKDYDKAIKTGEELLTYANGVDSLLIGAHSLLANAYSASGNRTKAMKQWQSILDLSQGNEKYKNLYVRAMIELASYYSDQRSLTIMQQLMDYYAENPPLTSSDSAAYINVCQQQASVLEFMGRPKESFQWMEKAVEMEEKHSGRNSTRYLYLMCDLVQKEFGLKGYESEAELIEKYQFVDDSLAMKIARKELDIAYLRGVSPIPFYSRVSGYYLIMESLYDHYRLVRNAKDNYFQSKSLDGFRRLLLEEYGADHPVYENLNMTLCVSYLSQAKFEKALECMQYERSTDWMAFKFLACLGLNDMDNAYNYAKAYLDGKKSEVLNGFKWMTAEERSSFWAKTQSQIKNLDQLSSCVSYSKIAPLLYDIQLFSKGLLLNTELELNKLLEVKGDSNAQRKLKEWREIKLSIDRISQSEEEYDAYRLLELSQQAVQLERELTLLSKEFGDFTKDLSISYKDVQRSLGKNDIAIEFATYRDPDNSIHYYALLLLPDTIHIVGLTNETTLRNSIPYAYTSGQVFNQIWKPLMPYFPVGGHIFFSADRLLHQVSIESLQGTEKYQFFRLSSTRELVRKKHYSKDTAVLYGGIDYSLTSDERKTISHTGEVKTYQDRPKTRDIRGAVGEIPYLPGSLNEIRSIEGTINHLLRVRTHTNIQGSEESFKDLSGKRPSIIHISTHGFYEDTSVDELFPQSPFAVRVKGGSIEDNSLSRSGLLMAGAADCLLSPDEYVQQVGAEDGILTAKEISRLDLRGLELVGLSACETGLGDITAEGVFGLQRGFKKAGAQSILMSLWKVDDEATCLLMTEFYKHWIGEGKTKHVALELAKQTVYSHTEKGWDDPKYWAAFILLDGLD